MSDDKRCGTCRLFNASAISTGWGKCVFKLPTVPDSFKNLVDKHSVFGTTMRIDEGTTCPCWEAKE